ncbi:MAG TPA: CDP-alcohol phosphatidyltransferase family protein, partial [Planctomycetota bacterium]|nr:CDP-alcohol phosphatidyltransferase family protein [Planctomycetota bacterium]
MTLANKITIGRFAVTIVYFVLLGIVGTGVADDRTLLYTAFFLFLAAVVGDGLDGYYARKYHQETNFGRIADPFVDKIMICGSFVFFLG